LKLHKNVFKEVQWPS